MKPFDPVAIELAGKNLIEASAGTGKTYAIASLYLRLLVEKELLPENILVVTFTEAATKELRERIRERIRQARDFFEGNSGEDKPDELTTGMLEAAEAGRFGGEKSALNRLEAALQSFDCAAISTIHGFCSRALKENAFESGSLYDTGLMANQTALLGEIADDFWRCAFFGQEAELLPLALGKKWSPESFAGFLKGKVENPTISVIPEFTDAEIADADPACRILFDAVAAEWHEKRDQLEELLYRHEALSRSKENFKPELLPELLSEMNDYLAGDRPYQVFSGLKKFTSTFILSTCKKKPAPPDEPFFVLCDQLAAAMEKRALILLWSLLDHARRALPVRKSIQNVRCYDDLLTDLHFALEGPGSDALALRICGTFKAALIDEFQDTDQLQYRIFRKIFNDDSIPLFLIGDPKQAIYSFRGADIFAYLSARDDIPSERHFTMDKNWRSTPQMVQAVNLLFSQQDKYPFLLEKLLYPDVSAARPEQQLEIAGRDSAPLQLWFMRREDGSEKMIDLNQAGRRIIEPVADEIAALLCDAAAGKVVLDGRPLEPSDIAVIVRSNKQAGAVYRALLERNIPAVIRTNAGIFQSAEAAETRILLGAIVEPGQESRIRAALATSIFGATAGEIAAFMDEESGGWEERLSVFHEYHEIWKTRGFIYMFRTLTAREKVRARLLSMPMGERRLTNFLHCGELLHNQETTSRYGMERLFTWFSEQIAAPPEGDEHQIRLESDEKAVRVLTVHISKGLEFPVVFCPFAWGGLADGNESVFCHDNGKSIIDYGSADFAKNRENARLECLSENLRLLYVTLTRAKYRCYLVWGRFRGVESSAPAYLLHAPKDAGAEGILQYLKNKLDKITDAEMLQPLQKMVESGAGSCSLVINPEPAESEYQWVGQDSGKLVLSEFGRKFETGWRVSSFTSFAAGHSETAELPDRDQQRENSGKDYEETSVEGSIFAFPRGARAGTFLHEIFEKISFSDAGGESAAGIVSSMLDRSFGKQWQNTLCTMLGNVCRARVGNHPESFTLADIPADRRITEMEFYFPLKKVKSTSVASILKKHGIDKAELTGIAEKLGFRETEGMVLGFIDLVVAHNGKYYIIDWKSNHLGNRAEDYNRDRLSKEMLRNMYPLQYLLYTVALNRHLERSDPGYSYKNNFGGAIYIFLRGVDPQHPQCGIYHDIPDVGLIRELTECLMDW